MVASFVRGLPLPARQFVTFAAVGAVGTAAHYALLSLLVEALRAPVVPATTAGFTLGAVVNYALNRRLTFGSEVAHSRALPKFMTIAIIGAALNAGIVRAILDHSTLHYLVAQVIATTLVLVGNFVANALWTFQK